MLKLTSWWNSYSRKSNSNSKLEFFNFFFLLTKFKNIKVLRLGRSHEMLESALKTIHMQDHFLRYVTTTSNLSQACYLVMDNLLWLHSIGLVKLPERRVREFSEWSNKFWLYSSILYLARDLHDYIDLVQTCSSTERDRARTDPTRRYQRDEHSGVYTSGGSSPSSSSSSSSSLSDRHRRRLLKQIAAVLMNRRNVPLHLDTIKNLFDVVLPLASLNYINVSPGVQGVCGLVSSLISLLIVWDGQYKLTPWDFFFFYYF